MMTLLGALLGFASSIFPEVLKIFTDKRDKAHEIQILQLQMAREQAGHTNKLEEAEIRYMAVETKALHDNIKTGVAWVDALNGTVRPVLAYAFFFLYAAVKLLAYIKLPGVVNIPIFMIYNVLWTAEDSAIFAGIISFYFGQRAFKKR